MDRRGPLRFLQVGADVAVVRALVLEDADAVTRALSDPATDVATFLRFAHQHRLAAFCYSTLHRLGLTRLLPPAMLTAMRVAALRERATAERLRAALLELRELLDGAEVLFIKGPLFADRYYAGRDARTMNDLDILIRTPAELDRVEHRLFGAGFTRAFHLPFGRRLARHFAHHFEYRWGRLQLDVHWALQTHVTFAIDDARIWETATSVAIEGRAFKTLSDEYELVLQIVGLLTDLQVGKLRLRSIVDIHQVVRTLDSGVDWDAFLARRKAEGLHRSTIYALALMLDVLACRHRFGSLAARLDPLRAHLPPTADGLRAILASRPLDASHKILALRLYDAPLWASAGWWAASLPVRLAVYGLTLPVGRKGG